jgi:hypothetical protein
MLLLTYEGIVDALLSGYRTLSNYGVMSISYVLRTILVDNTSILLGCILKTLLAHLERVPRVNAQHLVVDLQ